VACVGWAGEEQVIAEATALAPCGVNEAEYRAAIQGLRRAKETVTERPSISHVLLVSDSEPVVNTLTLRKDAHALRSLRAEARRLQGELEAAGVQVNYEWASRRSTKVKLVHALAANEHARSERLARRREPS
jgi:ribonuclease HI